MEQNKKEWRCPKCGRLLGQEMGFNKLEIQSSNKQKVTVEYAQRTGECKCGYKIRQKAIEINK